MGRLVNYGLGEVVDRLSILSLKIAHGQEQGRTIDHFLNEQAVLLTELRSRSNAGGAWFGRVIDLSVVNARLWQQEDEMRRYRSEDPRVRTEQTVVDTVVCAFQIQALNDHRAELIRQINDTVGDAIGMEKI